MDLAGQDAGEEGHGVFSHCYFCRDILVRTGFSGADYLAGLDYVTFYGIYRSREVFSCVGKVDSWARGVVASLDYGQTLGIDWETVCGMEKVHENLHAG